MKKFLSVILLVSLFICALPLCVMAESTNFLSEADSSFESGKTAWASFAGGETKVVDNPDGEGKVLEYSNTAEAKKWASPILDIKPLIQKNVKEETTVYIAMDIYTTGKPANLPLLIRTKNAEDFSLCAEADLNYATVGENRAEFELGVWKTFSAEFTVTEDDLSSKAEYWNLCFNGVYLTLGDDAIGAMYIDNIYIGTEEPENAEPEVSENPIPEKTAITRKDDTLIGAIRWDAYSKSTPDGKNASSQVAKTLSPKKYHAQVPFFGNINADGTVSFPEYTIETWEKEAEYAKDAGIDYFAYLWYETTDPMSEPRKLHLQSEQKDSVKMVAILESIRSTATMNELFEAMKDSSYITLDGRCVLFLYDMPKWDLEKVTKVRQMASNAGIEKALYIVGMDSSEKTLAENLKKDIDAISWYGMGSSKTAQPFSEMATACESVMTKMGSQAVVQNFGLIPCFTTGRDCSARIETAVTWIDGDPNATEDKDKPYQNKWTVQPTMAELESHITNVYNYVQTNTVATVPNMILSYGWNEHDEGGWLCPTIAVDENGNPLYNDDGTVKINTERLDTLKATLKKLTVPEEDITPSPEVSSLPTPTGPPNNNSATFNIWYIIIPAVIIIGTVVAVILLKKKKG